MMPLQALPPLPKSEQVRVGALDNGISYYLVTNPAEKGSADFSLVWKGGSDVEAARKPLRSAPHFQDRRPCDFLADKGIGYSQDGYVHVSEGSTSYRFNRVPMGDTGAVDSTLMLLFDIADAYAYEQAVIISGDISPDAVLQKMKLFSMMVAPRQKLPTPAAYTWTPVDSSLFTAISVPAKASFVSSMYQFPRTPEENMNTAQPLVSRMFSSMLRTILTRRLKENLREHNVPLSGVDYVYRSSAQGPGDEHYTITLHTLSDSLGKATEILASTLSALDRDGASLAEYLDAKDVFTSNLTSLETVSYTQNRSFIDRCTSAFLYGSDLAGAKTVTDFFAARQIPAEMEQTLFNNFIRALLDPKANLSVICIGDYPGTSDDLRMQFDSAWVHPAAFEEEAFRASYGDTLLLAQARGKVKLKSEVAEPVSGGKMWTFSNGIKVVYKRMPTPGRIRYALMVRGGYSTVPDLGQGEGAFVGDMLELSRVAGMSPYDFRKMLHANGISLSTEVSLSDLRISGTAPSSRLQLMLRSLLSLANDRQVDPEAFAYYKICEAVREEQEKGETEGVLTAIDHILFPDYAYSPWRSVNALGDDLPGRAATYFDQQFLRVNDGVLMILGDVDEDYLKKMLCRYLGGFRTSGTGFAARPKIQYPMRTGTSTYTVRQEDLEGVFDSSVNILLSAGIPFSTDKYMAFKMAGFAIRRSLVKALADEGMCVEVTDNYSLYPQERMELLIRCKAADAQGLPEGMVAGEPLAVLDKVRSALTAVASESLSKADLSKYKALLNDYFLSYIPRPEFVQETVMLRYSEGKDMVSRYRERIDGITAAQVDEIFAALRDGCRVEYVVD